MGGAPNGQKLGTYQLTAVLGCYYASQQCGNGVAPQFYASQTGTYYYFGGRMVKNAQGWVYPDRLGSIGKFYPYGTERPSATTNGTEKFTGYLRDGETGLDYADQRYEQPGMGRFLTADPGNAGYLSNPQSLNRYSYVLDDPINNQDPEGLCTVMVGGITQIPYTPDVTAQQDVATAIGAISAFPYAGGGKFSGVVNVLAQGAGMPTGATLTALEALALAAQNPGPIDIIAFSGGAQAFTTAWNYLRPDVQDRIQSITYVDPGGVGPFQGGVSGTNVNVLEDNAGFVNPVLQFFGRNPSDANYIDTKACGHNANCVFAEYLDWFQGGFSSCSTGAGGVFGAPASHSVQVVPTFTWLGPAISVSWPETPPVPSVTSKITFDAP
jgi:RHS repeat-associated protein